MAELLRCCCMPTTMPTRTVKNNDKAAPFEGYHNTSDVLLERKHKEPSRDILLDRNMPPSRSRPTIKQTRLSDSSMLFLYPQNSSDVKSTMSYTASDRKLFPKKLLGKRYKSRRYLSQDLMKQMALSRTTSKGVAFERRRLWVSRISF